jgi:hypothetical protein
MIGDNYYLITALEMPDELGSPPPIAPGALLEHLQDNRRAVRCVRALLLGDDLLQREAMLAEEIDQAAPAVLTQAQLRDEEPLPEPLTAPAETGHLKVPGDALWANYFRYVAAVARRENSEFLRRWVGFEVALRNALVTARATALGLEAGEYTVAEELADPAGELTAIVNEWGAAENPLSALRVLDRARWRWIDQNAPTYSFGDDELVAYAARLMLLGRWHRMSQPQQDQTT